jgi:hypothetical protein
VVYITGTLSTFKHSYLNVGSLKLHSEEHVIFIVNIRYKKIKENITIYNRLENVELLIMMTTERNSRLFL